MLEMPSYKLPRWGHVGFAMYESVKSFVLEAGKVIMAISIILWVLASYGPGDNMDMAEQQDGCGNAYRFAGTNRCSCRIHSA
jgi:ferrous iron transport protein B